MSIKDLKDLLFKDINEDFDKNKDVYMFYLYPLVFKIKTHTLDDKCYSLFSKIKKEKVKKFDFYKINKYLKKDYYDDIKIILKVIFQSSYLTKNNKYALDYIKKLTKKPSSMKYINLIYRLLSDVNYNGGTKCLAGIASKICKTKSIRFSTLEEIKIFNGKYNDQITLSKVNYNTDNMYINDAYLFISIVFFLLKNINYTEDLYDILNLSNTKKLTVFSLGFNFIKSNIKFELNQTKNQATYIKYVKFFSILLILTKYLLIEYSKNVTNPEDMQHYDIFKYYYNKSSEIIVDDNYKKYIINLAKIYTNANMFETDTFSIIKAIYIKLIQYLNSNEAYIYIKCKKYNIFQFLSQTNFDFREAEYMPNRFGIRHLITPSYICLSQETKTIYKNKEEFNYLVKNIIITFFKNLINCVTVLKNSSTKKINLTFDFYIRSFFLNTEYTIQNIYFLKYNSIILREKHMILFYLGEIKNNYINRNKNRSNMDYICNHFAELQKIANNINSIISKNNNEKYDELEMDYEEDNEPIDDVQIELLDEDTPSEPIYDDVNTDTHLEINQKLESENTVKQEADTSSYDYDQKYDYPSDIYGYDSFSYDTNDCSMSGGKIIMKNHKLHYLIKKIYKDIKILTLN
jgi:hypothetical protein